MRTMDASLISLVKSGAIAKETAMYYSANPEMIARMIS